MGGGQASDSAQWPQEDFWQRTVDTPPLQCLQEEEDDDEVGILLVSMFRKICDVGGLRWQWSKGKSSKICVTMNSCFKQTSVNHKGELREYNRNWDSRL